MCWGLNLKREKNLKTTNNKLYILTMTVFIIVLIFSIIKIVIWYKENLNNKRIMKNIKESVITIDDTISNEYEVNFRELKNINQDTIAWIKVNGTNIDYPVVQSKDNSYYLTHSFDKSYNASGWIFADYRNKLDGTDKNVVIFAHNRKDGSCFGSLKNVLTEEWKNNSENHIVKIYTENANKKYQVFSVYQILSEEYYITTNFKSNEEYNEFFKTIIERSEKNFNINVTEEDTILTLSTCADNNKYRVVLHAKEIIDMNEKKN